VATEFINDPLEKLSRHGSAEEKNDQPRPETEKEVKKRSETITIPVTVPRESIEGDSNLKIVLDVTLE